jgi:hypothetical protein
MFCSKKKKKQESDLPGAIKVNILNIASIFLYAMAVSEGQPPQAQLFRFLGQNADPCWLLPLSIPASIHPSNSRESHSGPLLPMLLDLSPRLLMYAATDAWATKSVFEHLLRKELPLPRPKRKRNAATNQ